MGTNYYLRPKACKCCGLYDKQKEVHIGKSSGGWCFSLHVGQSETDYLFTDYGFEPPESLEDWKRLFQTDGYHIFDEYGKRHTVDEMMEVIASRAWESSRDNIKWGEGWYSSYRDYNDYLRKNSAVDGPNNLLRHKLDGKHCIGHGEGTWDYITGEFS